MVLKFAHSRFSHSKRKIITRFSSSTNSDNRININHLTGNRNHSLKSRDINIATNSLKNIKQNSYLTTKFTSSDHIFNNCKGIPKKSNIKPILYSHLDFPSTPKINTMKNIDSFEKFNTIYRKRQILPKDLDSIDDTNKNELNKLLSHYSINAKNFHKTRNIIHANFKTTKTKTKKKKLKPLNFINNFIKFDNTKA